MRMRFLYMIALFIMLGSSPSALGQGGGFSFSVGVASSRMNDMKNLQKHILSTYPVDGKITSSFPPFTSATLTVFKQLYDQIRIGGAYSYTTSGGKSSYVDYSGNIATEINAMSHRLGAYLSYLVLDGDRLELSLNGRLDANYTSLTVQSYYTIYSYYNSITNKYRSISPSGTVDTELMYKFDNFSLGLDAGYLVDLTGKLKDTDNGKALLDPNDLERTLTTDWTGWFVQFKAIIGLKF